MLAEKTGGAVLARGRFAGSDGESPDHGAEMANQRDIHYDGMATRDRRVIAETGTPVKGGCNLYFRQ